VNPCSVYYSFPSTQRLTSTPDFFSLTPGIFPYNGFSLLVLGLIFITFTVPLHTQALPFQHKHQLHVIHINTVPFLPRHPSVYKSPVTCPVETALIIKSAIVENIPQM
jgi:hypothetical protein